MKINCLLLMAAVALSGCSASVRPVYSDTADVTPEMRAQADSLGLSLSDAGKLILAKSLAQGETYCAMNGRIMTTKIAMKARGNSEVPVVHIQCDQAPSAAP